MTTTAATTTGNDRDERDGGARPPRPSGLLGLLGLLGSLDAVGRAVGNAERLVADTRRDAAAVARDAAALHRAAADRAAATKNAFAAAPRIARVVGHGLTLLAAYRFDTSRAAAFPGAAADTRRDALHRERARRLRDLCIELGGGALKLGQFLACRPDLLPPAYIEALGELCDRVPPADPAAIRARVEAELGAPIGAVFETFDDAPIAAASLAQVHAATTPGGAEVAVKVQRPGVEVLIDADSAALRTLAGFVSEIWTHVDARTAAFELAASIRRELDYTAEAAHIGDFGRAFADHPGVVVPRLYPALSTDRVLTMQRIRGARLTDFLDAPDTAAADRDKILFALVDSYAAQILSRGLLQSDPHPGNFLVAPGPTLALLDFGSVARLAPDVRAAYAGLVGAALTGDRTALARHLNTMGFESRDGDPAGLVAVAEVVLAAVADSASRGAAPDWERFDPAEQLSQIMDILRRHPVARVPEHFVMVGRVLTAISGLISRYRPQISLFAAIGPHLAYAQSCAPTWVPP